MNMKPLITPDLPTVSKEHRSTSKNTNNSDNGMGNFKNDLLLRLMESYERNESKHEEPIEERLKKQTGVKSDNFGHLGKTQASFEFESEEFYDIPSRHQALPDNGTNRSYQTFSRSKYNNTERPANQHNLPLLSHTTNGNKTNSINNYSQRNVPHYLSDNSNKPIISESALKKSKELYLNQCETSTAETEATAISSLQSTPLPSEQIVSPTSINIDQTKYQTKGNNPTKRIPLRLPPLLLPPIYTVRPRPLKEREFLTPTRLRGPVTDEEWDDLFQCRYLRHITSRHPFKIHTH